MKTQCAYYLRVRKVYVLVDLMNDSYMRLDVRQKDLPTVFGLSGSWNWHSTFHGRDLENIDFTFCTSRKRISRIVMYHSAGLGERATAATVTFSLPGGPVTLSLKKSDLAMVKEFLVCYGGEAKGVRRLFRAVRYDF